MKRYHRYLGYVGDMGNENRFATKAEIASMLEKIDISDPSATLPKAGIPIISDTKTVYADTEDYHALILGSTGSMKTRTVILPTVFSLAMAEENMVIADPKGEIYAKTSSFLKEHGYIINVLNLRDLKHSDAWNPLEEAYRLYHEGLTEEGLALAAEFVNAITAVMTDVRAPSWSINARKMLEGLTEIMIRGAKTSDECNPGSLGNLLDLVKDANKDPVTHGTPDRWGGDSKNRTLLEFVEGLPDGSTIRANLLHPCAMSDSATSTLAGIIDQAYGGLAPFTSSEALMSISGKTTIDIHALASAEEKHAIFLIVPDEDTSLHFFASSFIKQLYGVMIKESYRSPSEMLPRRLNFVLDEFANLPRIEDMPSMITAARSRNMRFFLVVQSDNQLRSAYQADAETIKTNCLTWVYLSTKEDALIQQIQRMVGVKSNRTGEPLISYHELTSLRKIVPNGGVEALVLLNRARPYVTFLPDISRYEQFVSEEIVPLPETEMGYVIFPMVARALSLSKEKANEIYGSSLTRFSTPVEPEEEPEEDGDPAAELKSEKKPSSFDSIADFFRPTGEPIPEHHDDEETEEKPEEETPAKPEEKPGDAEADLMERLRRLRGDKPEGEGEGE